ncbi:MAG TPA: sn-glycerol-3-phosphate ABC transporter ATP-binding protein UgpC [Chthoniobacteraceae bacterium]|jgi:multiple sugar transport system ATP-binding protein|nr:sn-glycerol-3-phosphate ABC transporter ATP-binding protein UgpC [Chthoniobacteraceae bacterium]
MAKVSVQHVSKFYPPEKGKTEAAAVSDFNLEVKDREFVVFVGPSGCGKSTTLRMIAGLEEITKGDIYIGEKRVNDMAPKDRDIAMVFQNYALYPHMSVYDNLAFGLKLRKFPKAEIKKRVCEAAGILGIEKYLDRKPKALSGGERQRVAVGRAIVRQPKVFLFDEPLSNLDAKMRVQMRTEIIKLHQRLQATMIYVTHDQVEAMTMGDRIVVMKDGVIQQTDAPLALYRQPANLFVAGFLGSPPMNFMRGTVREAGGGLIFKETKDGVVEIKMTDRPEAKAFAGREIILGIRPEDIEIVTGTDRPTGLRFQSLVDIVEHMGAEANIYLQTGAHTLVCRTETPVGNEEVGHRMQFEIDPARIHLFDPETARRIVAE